VTRRRMTPLSCRTRAALPPTSGPALGLRRVVLPIRAMLREFRQLRDGVGKRCSRQRRYLRHHIDAVVGPYAELVVVPVRQVFMDQLIPSPGDRHSPDEREEAIGLADLASAIGHRLPQITNRIGIPIPKPLHHALMVTRLSTPGVAALAAFQTIWGTFQDEPTMPPRAYSPLIPFQRA